jgi:LPXTG-site transpeptidase (sortase) family protein
MAPPQVSYNADKGLINDMIHRQRRLTAPPSLPRQQPPQKKAALESEAKTVKQKLMNRGTGLTAMAGFIFLVGLTVSGYSLLNNHRVTQQVQALSSSNASSHDDVTSGNEPPDETPIPTHAMSSYQVAPDLPRYLKIKKLGVMARVKPLGVSNDNELLAPKSTWDVGWYNASAKPGQDAGAAVIDGHVLGSTKGGVFYNLKKLGVGDIIEIERGDGRLVHYKVARTQQVDAKGLDMRQLMTSEQPGKQGLNLITCAGKFSAKTQTFDQRAVVFSVQVD